MFLPPPSPWACGCCRWVLRFSYGTVAGGTDAQFLADKGSSVFLGQTKLQQMSDEIFQNMASIMALAERMAVRKNACAGKKPFRKCSNGRFTQTGSGQAYHTENVDFKRRFCVFVSLLCLL